MADDYSYDYEYLFKSTLAHQQRNRTNLQLS